MVTEDDKNSIDYFFNQKGDIERWASWEDRKADIEAEYPELIHALNQVKIANRVLSAIVKSVIDD